MIRWLCYSLVVLNGFLFWVGVNAPAPVPASVAHPNLPRVDVLLLVGEREAPAPGDACYVVSGFDSESDAQAWAGRLGLGAAVEFLERDLKLPPYYWVVVPPHGSRDGALETLGYLQQQGFDSFLIGAGEWRNGISLGLFADRQAAEIHRAASTEAGFESTMTELPRNGKLRGLRGGESLRAAVSSENLQFRGLALSLQHCSGVAKANKNP